MGAQYWDRDHKLAFMDKHGIDISIVSLMYLVLRSLLELLSNTFIGIHR